MGRVVYFPPMNQREVRESNGNGIYYGAVLRRLVLGRKPRRTWRAIWVLCACAGVGYGIVRFL